MSTNITTFNTVCSKLGISVTKLQTLANSSTPAGTGTATTTVAGTLKVVATDPDNAAVIPASAPAGGTGTAAGGWDTAANRDLAITTINGLVTAVTSLKADHNDLLAKLRTAGHLAP